MVDHDCRNSYAKIKIKMIEGDKVVEKEMVLADTKTIFNALAEDHARKKTSNE